MLEFAHQLLPMYLDEFVTYVPGSSQASRKDPPYDLPTAYCELLTVLGA